MVVPVQEERFMYRGYPCVVLFMPMAYRCGYAGIPEGHRLYKKACNDMSIECHCGLTYSSNYLHRQDDANTWWIGFDCGHACDGLDIAMAKKLYANEPRIMHELEYMEGYFKLMENYPVRSLEYVKNECRKIVDQLVEEE